MKEEYYKDMFGGTKYSNYEDLIDQIGSYYKARIERRKEKISRLYE
jgi:hypothetical protein